MIKTPSKSPKSKRIPIESKTKKLIDMKDKRILKCASIDGKYGRSFDKILIYSNNSKTKFESSLNQIMDYTKQKDYNESICEQLKRNPNGEILVILNDKVTKM